MTQSEFYEAKLAYEIDSWDLAEAMKHNEAIIVIDARSSEAYAREHIPSSINIPHRQMSEEKLSRLDPDKSYVTYCDGIGCNASTKAALKMSRHGLKVRELLGGLDWWKRDGYSTEGSEASVGTSVIDCGC